MKIDELLKIENKIEGNEFFSAGITYCVSFDSVENMIFDYLLKCRAITEEILNSMKWIRQVTLFLRMMEMKCGTFVVLLRS